MNKRKYAMLPVILFILAVIITVGTVVVLDYDTPEADPANSFGNLANGGYVAQSGRMLYYVTGEKELICRLSANDGGNKTYDVDSGNIKYLCPYNSGIIYLKDNSIIYSLYDGSGKKTLAENAKQMMVSGNWIYFKDGANVIKKFKFGSDEIKSLEVVSYGDFAVSGTTVMYLDKDSKLRSVSTDGSGDEQFFSEKIDKFAIDNSFIIYISEGRLCTVASGNVAYTSEIDKADEFIMCGETIVYKKDGSLYYKDLSDDASKAKSAQLHGKDPVSLCFAGDKLYYYNSDGALVSSDIDGGQWKEM